jgi:ABC-type Zn2+ transport system substrate-binding protein/surface adhesin
VTISNPFENKIVKTLEQVMKGFPIGVQLIEDGMRAVKEVEEREEEDREEEDKEEEDGEEGEKREEGEEREEEE